MATGSIKSNNGIAYGTIAKYSSITSGTIDLQTCYKVGNVVSVSGRIHSMNNPIANGSWFQIPQGFRPTAQTRGAGYMQISGNMVPLMATVNTDGTVVIEYSSSATCTQVAFSATYAIH